MPGHCHKKILIPGSRFFIVDDIRLSCFYGRPSLYGDRDRCQAKKE